MITDIQEKNKISNYYCCGLYGFKNCEKFISIAKFIITNDIKDKNEFYFSKVYKSLLDKKEKINVFYIEKTEHIGSFDEIMFNSSLITSNKLRVCFDLDNTLVTYPQIPGDYTTVKPIEKNITTLRDLKNKGHTIIIYTARRMTTHGNNIGKVLKDIGMITFNTLDQFNIPYDEIIFGKPIADIYIDDRAINPYINNISYFGIFEDDNELILNKIPNNKYNIIRRYGNKICKLGPSKYIKGEYYFYTHIPTNLKHLFVDFYSMIEKNDCIEIEIKYIKSIPLFYLYKNELITYKIINHLFDILKELHSFKGNDILDIDYNNVSNNYFLKLKNRLNDVDYPFPDVNDVFNEIISGLKENYDPEIVNIIHGDYWFSNILLTYENEYKIIDMKGQVDGILTLNGDKYYDYGKFYQSIIGYDLVLNGFELNNEYINEMNTFFLDLCCKNGLNINYLKYVTKSLIFGTFHSISDENIENRNAIWNLLKSIK